MRSTQTRNVVIAKKADRTALTYGIAVEPNRRLITLQLYPVDAVAAYLFGDATEVTLKFIKVSLFTVSSRHAAHVGSAAN